MQYFEWECEGGGVHWKKYESETDRLASMGITACWLPREYHFKRSLPGVRAHHLNQKHQQRDQARTFNVSLPPVNWLILDSDGTGYDMYILIIGVESQTDRCSCPSYVDMTSGI
jgi:hypothetical protein